MLTTPFNGRNPTLCPNGKNSVIVFHGPTSKSQLPGRTPTSQHHGLNSTSHNHDRTPTSTVCLNGRQSNCLSTSSKVNSQLLLLTRARWVIFKNPLPYLGWGCSTEGRWGQLPSAGRSQLASWPSLWPSCPTLSTAAGICLYYFITPTCFCFFFRLFALGHL